MRTKLYSFSTRLITVVLGLVSLLLIALLAVYLQEQIAMQADALIRSSLRWKFLFAAGLLVVGGIVLFKLLSRIPLFPCVRIFRSSIARLCSFVTATSPLPTMSTSISGATRASMWHGKRRSSPCGRIPE